MTATAAAGRTALVTGAANGIGRAIALRLDRRGHPLVLVDRDGEALEALRQSLGGRPRCVVADVTDDDAPRRAASLADSVAILVNNAGIAPKTQGRGHGLLETTDALWDQVQGINFRSMFRFCREVVPSMQRAHWGRIVNISSLGGRTKSLIAGPGYMSSKAAIHGLTRSIAAEFAASGITANAIAPGRIAGRLESATDPAINDAYRAAIPVGRFGEPDEVAALVEFLVGDDAGFMTGTVSDLNGGYFMA